MPYLEGYKAGLEGGGGNIFTTILSSVVKAKLRRDQEDREFLKAMEMLAQKTEAEKEKTRFEEEGRRKTAILTEREKAKLKPTQEAIVDDTGNIVGYRPTGSVFQPRPDPTEAIIAALGGGQNIPERQIPLPIKPKKGKRVEVFSPEGILGNIPEEQLEEALKQGYKRK